MRAALLVACWALAGCAGAQPPGVSASPPSPIGGLRWIGSITLPTGTLFEGVEFGGISGLDRAPDGRYWALSDDRGGERGPPRFYELKIDLDAQALHSVTIERMVVLQDPDGQPLPTSAPSVDPEALRVAPNGHLYIASEGHWSRNASARHQPFVREFQTDGRWVRSFALPEAFDYVDNATTGARTNKVWESLAVTPSGAVFVANEEALIDDGPVATVSHGSWLRVLKLDSASGQPLAQHAYALPPIPLRRTFGEGAPVVTRADNGLTDLLAVEDSSFIAVERAYVPGQGVSVRLVLTRIEGGTTDVSGFESLLGTTFQPLSREVLLELPIPLQGLLLDNIEAIAWGPVLANGNRSLILVSDNNFSRLQSTQFLALEVLPR
ncbi:esterase-like activity of phytase family protein [Hydrogenophaga sp.]|uniref:esterase-like activity of phytase family protein n=1 Tax=Hydrogenophaga sp. TaxID=1904254 RepID=UPI0025C05E9B|nr:esterase-like activity of phytase family protein [Hydrogenophaga sp.]